MSDTTATVKYRKDYAPTDFRIDQVHLDFFLEDEYALVTSELSLSRRADSSATKLFLDGWEKLHSEDVLVPFFIHGCLLRQNCK